MVRFARVFHPVVFRRGRHFDSASDRVQFQFRRLGHFFAHVVGPLFYVKQKNRKHGPRELACTVCIYICIYRLHAFVVSICRSPVRPLTTNDAIVINAIGVGRCSNSPERLLLTGIDFGVTAKPYDSRRGPRVTGQALDGQLVVFLYFQFRTLRLIYDLDGRRRNCAHNFVDD